MKISKKLEEEIWKGSTKLGVRIKIGIVLDILIAIFNIVIGIVERNEMWIICGLLWIIIALQNYCDNKLLKAGEAIIDMQEIHIETQGEIINTLLKETAIEIDINRIKIPKYYTKPNPEKLKARFNYYKQHKRFYSPIVIDNNYTLIDGYTSYLIAKNYHKTTVIAHIKLDVF